MKNVVKALTNVAPRVAVITDQIARGQLHDLNIAADLAQAAESYRNLKNTGGDVETYLAQFRMPGFETESETAQAFMRMFESNRQSAKAITQALTDVLDRVEGYGDPKQVSMFGDQAIPSLAELVRASLAQSGVERATAKNGVADGQIRFMRDAAEQFSTAYDAWDKKDGTKSFTVGYTSPALESVGLPARPIIWDGKKIIRIKSKHPGMTDAVIKRVPEVIQNPIVVMKSRTVSDRFTMFGELNDDNGAPVLVVLNPNPKINGSYTVDVISVSSAYGKDTDTQDFINNSNILYVDKERAGAWTEATRLYLPSATEHLGSDHNIPRDGNIVKRNIIDRMIDEAPDMAPTQSGPVRSGQEIIQTLADAIGIPVDARRKTYLRGVRKQTSGYTREGSGVIHVGDAQAIDTAAHEFGHNFDHAFDLQAHADISGMIRSYSADPVQAAWLNRYPEADRGKEMMAEYVKTWLQDRATAVQFGGQSFTDYFENSLKQRDWLKPMQTAAQDMRAYLAATSGERAKASIDLVENGKNVDKYAKGLKGLAKAVFDRTLPLTQLTQARRAAEGGQFNASKDVRTLALAKESTIANMVSECLYGKNMVDPEGNTVSDLDGASIGSLGDILGQVDRRQEKDFNALWALLHAKDRQAVGKAVFGKNIDVDAAIQQIESANPELRHVIDQAENWYTTFMQIWTVETGMIDQETFDTLRKTYPHYVPTFRSGANLDDFVQTAIRMQNSPGNGLKTAKGATSNLYNPVMGLVEYVQRYIANYKNVEVLRAFDDTMRNIPGLEGIAEPVQGDMQRTDNRSANEQARQTVQQTIADMLKSGNITPEGETAMLDALDTLPEQGWIATDRATGNDVLNIPMQDGSISRYTVYNAPILKAILGQPASRRAKWLRAAARCTGFLCSMATGRNLGFAGQNWFSDSETAMNTGHAAGTWITYIPQQLMTMANYLKNTINDKRGANVDEAFRLFQTFGKMGSRFAFRDTKTQAEARRSLYGGKPRVSEVMKSIVTSPLVGLENISGFIEDSTRYNEFRNSGHDLTTYSGRLEAGKGAREATVDFTKSGDAEDLKYAKGVVPFLGAQLQGIYKTARLFSSENAGNRVKTAGRILVNGVLFSLVMKAIRNLTWDDDEKDAYDQMAPYERNKYWHIKQEDGTFIRIKRSQDAIIQIADATGEWLGNVLTGYETDWGDLMAIANEISANAVVGFDTVFDPFFDAANNKTWYGGAIEDNRMEEMSTTGRYTEETSPVYRTLSYALNALGVKYSPLDVEYIVKQFTSSMGKTGSGILGLAESGELTLGNVLSTIGNGIGDSYMTDPVYTNNISGTFYTGKTALEQMVNEAKQGRAPEGFRADLTQEESNAALAEGTALTSKGGAVYNTYKATKDLWKQHDDILNNPNMTEEDKAAAAREVRRQINTAMLQGNAVIADYIKKYGYTGDVEQNIQNMLSSMNGGKAVPIAQTALDTLPDAFKADADEPYMKQATALWQATGKDSALPNPNTSFTVNGTKYEIGSEDWDNFTAKYKQAYVSYLAQNSTGWDALSTEDQLEVMGKAHTAGTNAAKKWYMKLHKIK